MNINIQNIQSNYTAYDDINYQLIHSNSDFLNISLEKCDSGPFLFLRNNSCLKYDLSFNIKSGEITVESPQNYYELYYYAVPFLEKINGGESKAEKNTEKSVYATFELKAIDIYLFLEIYKRVNNCILI